MTDETTPIKEPSSPEQPVVPPTEASNQPPKKPVYKKWWFWAIMVVLAIGVLGNLGDGESTVTAEPEEPAVEAVVEDEAPESAPEPEESVVEREPEPEPAEPAMTMGQEQAIGKARDYLAYSAFSRQGLIDQLVFEDFSTDDATFAVDHIAPDWDEQAAKKAEDYLNYSSFSRQGLIEQLVFEGFTQAQAEHGATAVGY